MHVVDFVAFTLFLLLAISQRPNHVTPPRREACTAKAGLGELKRRAHGIDSVFRFSDGVALDQQVEGTTSTLPAALPGC